MRTPFKHPLATHAAWTVLGYRKDGRPIYAIAGGNGEGEGGSGTGGTGDGGQGGNEGTPPNGPAGGQPGPWDSFTWDGNVDSLPPDIAKAIRDARADAGKARTNAKAQAAQEAREELLRQLSGNAEKPKTAEELATELKQSQTSAQEAQVQAAAAAIELQVYRTANRLGADAERLLDSRSFLDSVDSLDVDPTDRAAFTTAVEQLITQTLQQQPGLRSTPTAGRSGTTKPPAGAGAQTPARPSSLSQAIRTRLGS